MAESRAVVTATAACFLAAFFLGCVSLATPAWIQRDFQAFPPPGNCSCFHLCLSRYGLFTVCEESLYNDQRRNTCKTETISSQWAIAAGLMLIGLFILLVAVISTLYALVRTGYLNRAKWQAFYAAIALALSSLVFPVGFSVERIGGEPYRLPENTNVGYSYVLFIICLVFVFVGELFATRVIFPAN
eukprot:m.57321 g.57321  ORF g.57321 m.57321 type:complete len:187 (-) comp13071_c0_seq2:146-706(-)